MRDKYLSPSLRTFQAYDTPLVLKKGEMQYVWDSEDNKYVDLYQNYVFPKIPINLFQYNLMYSIT